MFDRTVSIIVDTLDNLGVKRSEYASIMFSAIAEKTERERIANAQKEKFENKQKK